VARFFCSSDDGVAAQPRPAWAAVYRSLRRSTISPDFLGNPDALRANAFALIVLPMKPEQCTQQIVVRVPAAQRREIEIAAAAEGRSLGNMMRRIIDRWAADRGERQNGEGAAA
jgi:hypothetical protein